MYRFNGRPVHYPFDDHILSKKLISVRGGEWESGIVGEGGRGKSRRMGESKRGEGGKGGGLCAWGQREREAEREGNI